MSAIFQATRRFSRLNHFYYAKGPGFSSGKLTSCVNCHNAAKTSDYVYSVWFLREKP